MNARVGELPVCVACGRDERARGMSTWVITAGMSRPMERGGAAAETRAPGRGRALFAGKRGSPPHGSTGGIGVVR